MDAKELHESFRGALSHFAEPRAEALRALIEAGGVENFLTGLLYIELHAAGMPVSREFPIGNRCAADLTLHPESDVHVELKQLNLKDGCLYAPQILINDLSHHGYNRSFGIMYVSNERLPTAALRYMRFGGANRRAKHDVRAIREKLPEYFGRIYPETASSALLRSFRESGGFSIYGFVVSEPLLPATAKQRQVPRRHRRLAPISSDVRQLAFPVLGRGVCRTLRSLSLLQCVHELRRRAWN